MKNREELLQEIVEKLIRVLKSTRHGSYPFKDFDINRQQACILFRLVKTKEGVSMKDLAQELDVTNGAITQFLDDLVTKELVVREHDVKDRRTIRVKLTPNAQEDFANFKERYFKTLSPRFNQLTDDELYLLSQLIKKIDLI